MGWEDQGRQEHGWFGHGTTEKALPDPSVTDRSLAALPASQRRRLETQYHHGLLPRFTEAVTAWTRGAKLDPSLFASLFFGSSADDPVVQALHGAASAARSATNHGQMRAASKAIDLLGVDGWSRFVIQAQARANDPVTMATVAKSQQPIDTRRSDAITPVYPVETALGIGAAGVAAGVGAAVRAGVGAAVRQVLPKARPSSGKLPLTQEAAQSDISNQFADSVRDKLYRYTLNREHAEGGSKAKWFEQALGFTRDNIDDLARQIVFDEKTAVQTSVTEYGTKFNQTINIIGANNRTIPVVTAWMKGQDGVSRLITAIPGR